MTELNDEILLRQFVTVFAKLDEWIEHGDDTTAESQVLAVDASVWSDSKPKPVEFQTSSRALNELYEMVPLRFPPLFEKLLLLYRWPEVDLGFYRLASNLPGEDFNGFFHAISGDEYLWDALIPAGYLPFGKGPDIDYDPVCFDYRPKSPKRGRIVKIDHEEILCHNRIKIVTELAPDFRQLLLKTLRLAELATPPSNG